MFKTKPTVTIGIPAYNEEANIGNLLASIHRQIASSYTIEKIVVLCDGCTDNTYKIAHELAEKYPKLQVLRGVRRMGKSVRLTELFAMSTSTIFVSLDADITLGSGYSLDFLIKPFRIQNIGLTSGNDLPYPSNSLFSQISHESFRLWYETRKNIGKGNSVHNIHGNLYALRRDVYRTCHIPGYINADDHFVYFQNKLLGFDHAFVTNATAYVVVPTNLKDYLLQGSRYLQAQSLIRQHFGSWVDSYYKVPSGLKIHALFTRMKRHPILLVDAVMLQLLLRQLRFFLVQKRDTGRWDPIQSTKISLSK